MNVFLGVFDLIAIFFTLLIPCFFHLERLVFHLERHERLFMGLFDLKKTQDKKMQIFEQNHGLTLSKTKSFATFQIRYF